MISCRPLVLALLLCVSCATYSTAPQKSYRLPLVRVESGTGQVLERKASTVGHGGTYRDNYLTVMLVPGYSGFNITMENKSSETARFIWDEAVYVDPFGRASGVGSGQQRMIDTGKSERPAVIPPGTRMTDLIVPTSNVVGSDLAPFLYEAQLTPDLNGREMRLILPVEIGSRKQSYTMVFQVAIQAGQ